MSVLTSCNSDQLDKSSVKFRGPDIPMDVYSLDITERATGCVSHRTLHLVFIGFNVSVMTQETVC